MAPTVQMAQQVQPGKTGLQAQQAPTEQLVQQALMAPTVQMAQQVQPARQDHQVQMALADALVLRCRQ